MLFVVVQMRAAWVTFIGSKRCASTCRWTWKTTSTIVSTTLEVGLVSCCWRCRAYRASLGSSSSTCNLPRTTDSSLSTICCRRCCLAVCRRLCQKWQRTCASPFTRYSLLSNRLYNRLYRVNKHPTGCQTGFDNRFDNRVERTAVRSTGCQTGFYNRFDNRLYTRYNRLSNRFDNRFDNRLYRVNGASEFSAVFVFFQQYSTNSSFCSRSDLDKRKFSPQHRELSFVRVRTRTDIRIVEDCWKTTNTSENFEKQNIAILK